MPSKSQSQQRLFAVAEHDPEALYKKNASLRSLSKQTLHDFATTKRTGLPEHVPHHERTKAYVEKRKAKDNA